MDLLREPTEQNLMFLKTVCSVPDFHNVAGLR